jgi:membrane protein YqaA with SNARE-associated domain
MGILGLLVTSESVWKWVQHLGGPGLILLGLASHTPFISAPAGSVDVFLILLSAHRSRRWVYYAFLATVGEVLGGYLSYWLAEKGSQETLEKKVGKPRAAKIYEQFEKRGFMTVFTGSILPPPFPFTPVLTAAGIMQYPRKKFLSALAAGRATRFVSEAFLGRVYGQQMIEFVLRHNRPLLFFPIALAVTVGIGALVYFKWYWPRKQRAVDKAGQSSLQ